MNVKELAKELSMNSRELLEKMEKVGIKAKTVDAELSEDDIATVKAKLGKKQSAETKVVKRSPKKETKKEDAGEPKVTVKTANIKLPSEIEKPAPAKTKAAKATPSTAASGTAKPPVGTPVVPKNVENRKKTVKPPVGTPVVPKDLHEKDEEKPAAKKTAKTATEKKTAAKTKAAEEKTAAKKTASKGTETKKTTAKETAAKKPAAKKETGAEKEKPVGPIIVRTAAEEKDRKRHEKISNFGIHRIHRHPDPGGGACQSYGTGSAGPGSRHQYGAHGEADPGVSPPEGSHVD